MSSEVPPGVGHPFGVCLHHDPRKCYRALGYVRAAHSHLQRGACFVYSFFNSLRSPHGAADAYVVGWSYYSQKFLVAGNVTIVSGLATFKLKFPPHIITAYDLFLEQDGALSLVPVADAPAASSAASSSRDLVQVPAGEKRRRVHVADHNLFRYTATWPYDDSRGLLDLGSETILAVTWKAPRAKKQGARDSQAFDLETELAGILEGGLSASDGEEEEPHHDDYEDDAGRGIDEDGHVQEEPADPFEDDIQVDAMDEHPASPVAGAVWHPELDDVRTAAALRVLSQSC